MRHIGLFLLIFPGLAKAGGWSVQEDVDPFTDEVNFSVTTQAQSAVTGKLSEFRFFCDTGSVSVYESEKAGFRDLEFRTMSVEMLFEQAAFNPRHKVSLTVRLDKDAPYTSRVKPVSTNTILFKNEYDFFTEITEAKQLAIKTESWSGEDYWIFDVADLGKYSAKFDSICPEQGLIEAGAAQSTSLKEFYAVEEAKELEKEKQKQEQLEKERHEAEQARLKEDQMAQKTVAAEKEALTPERSHFIATEAERYGAIYEQQIKKNLLMEDSYKGKSCKLNLRLIPTGSNAILGGVSILDGDSRLCAATKRGVAQVSSYPLPSDKDVASELKSVDLNIVVE